MVTAGWKLVFEEAVNRVLVKLLKGCEWASRFQAWKAGSSNGIMTSLDAERRT
jgi:hypothetical protein